MKGMIYPIQIGLFMAIIKAGEGGYGAFYKIPGTNENVLVRAKKRKSKIKTTIKDGRPELHIRVKYQSEIIEKERGNVKIDDPTVIRKIEQSINKKINKEIKVLINEMQKEESDIFGFGEYVRAKHPAYWKEHVRTKENWHNIYKDLKVQVETESHIIRTGMTAK